jgi:hypothetical protein
MPLIVVKIIDFKRLQDCRLNTFADFPILLRGVYPNPFRTAVFHFVQNVFLKGGFTQTLTTKCYAFRWVFICVRVCEQAHTASTNKNPVTFVTGFVPFAGMSSIEIEAELVEMIKTYVL